MMKIHLISENILPSNWYCKCIGSTPIKVGESYQSPVESYQTAKKSCYPVKLYQNRYFRIGTFKWNIC